MAPYFSSLPVTVINMEREGDRKRATKEFLQSIGLQQISFLKAHDAQELIEKSGRSKKIRKGTWRVAYDIEDSKTGKLTHQSFVINSNGLGRAGCADFWAQHGCSVSHRDALVGALETLEQHAGCLIVEDDLITRQTMQNGSDVRATARKIIDKLDKRFPKWVCFLLGGMQVSWQAGTNQPCGIGGVRHADYVMQAHCVYWRATPHTGDVIRTVIKK